tara:strand:- start:7500 stop:7823 length:324 start_codon:yes stop_codon:yes gene_type:complete
MQDDKRHTHATILPMKTFAWDSEKNQKLVEERGISFDDAVFFINNGGLIDDVAHTNTKKYPNQRMFLLILMNIFIWYRMLKIAMRFFSKQLFLAAKQQSYILEISHE